MKRTALTVAILLAGSASMVRDSTAQGTNQVRAEGCVEAGVEARCLVVKDTKSGKLYNLLIKGSKPEIGDGIAFTGVPFDGTTYCMQGIAIQVTEWSRKDSLKCKQDDVPNK